MHSNRPVLIAYDGSSDSRAAVRATGQFFPGAPAVVLYVREPLEAVAAHLEGHPAVEELRAADQRTLDASDRPTLVVPPEPVAAVRGEAAVARAS